MRLASGGSAGNPAISTERSHLYCGGCDPGVFGAGVPRVGTAGADGDGHIYRTAARGAHPRGRPGILDRLRHHARASGDPVQLMLAGAEAGVTTPERIAELRKSMGLDRPLYLQYGGFIVHALRGDLGQSIRFQAPVNDLIFVASLQTFQLSLAGMAAALLIGIPLGFIAGLYENSWADSAAMVVSLLGVSMPLFWLALLLILAVSIHLQWL